MIEFKDFQILSRTFRQYNDTLELYQLGDDSHLYRVRNKLVSVVGVNPPANIASGRIAEVRSRSMSCNCMTRTSQQECRGILEYAQLLHYYRIHPSALFYAPQHLHRVLAASLICSSLKLAYPRRIVAFLLFSSPTR